VLEDSWWEQREWGITWTVETLIAGKHRMVDGLLAELDALQPELPSPVVRNKPFLLSPWILLLCMDSAAVHGFMLSSYAARKYEWSFQNMSVPSNMRSVC
jgi:hypothetical protein